jgi:hypothetical protein
MFSLPMANVRRHEDDTSIARVVETPVENGMESTGEAFGIMFNVAMEIERARLLGAGRYERNENRPGPANGREDKTVNSRVGKITLKVARGTAVGDGAGETGPNPDRLSPLRVPCLRTRYRRPYGLTTMFWSNETWPAAEPCISALPSSLAPVSSEIEVPAIIVPFIMEFAPRAIALPAVQKMFPAWALPWRTTSLVDSVVIVVALRMMKTALASPPASR